MTPSGQPLAAKVSTERPTLEVLSLTNSLPVAVAYPPLPLMTQLSIPRSRLAVPPTRSPASLSSATSRVPSRWRRSTTTLR